MPFRSPRAIRPLSAASCMLAVSVPGGITSIRSELVTRLYNGGTGRAWNWQ